MWSVHRDEPSLRPTATLIDSSSRRKPTDVIGGSVEPISRMGRESSFQPSLIICTRVRSQQRSLTCFDDEVVPGSLFKGESTGRRTDRLAQAFPLLQRRSHVWINSNPQARWEDLVTRSAVPAAKAKKADGASRHAFLIPRHPSRIGKEAWIQRSSSWSTFRISIS